MRDELDLRTRAVRDDVVGWRRHLHAHPELSFAEHETAQWVHDQLAALDGVEVSRPTETGLVARLVGGRPGPTLAIRADMDALPIVEDTGLPFASTVPGVMHACGHDGHTAILLGVATALSQLRADVPGEIRFLLEPGEETLPGGAAGMVAAGVMEGVDRVIGLHLWAPVPVGDIVVRPGPLMAACDVFRIVVHGRGGHISAPHTTVDPIAVGAQIVTALQQIVARNVDPQEAAVVSVTEFHAGETVGVIPQTAVLSGGTNAFSADVMALLERRIEKTATGVAAALGATVDVEYTRGYGAVLNDAAVTETVGRTARELFGEDRVGPGIPLMAGEDFSAFQREAPGCFVLVGAGNAERSIVHEHHHPRFDIDEESLDHGVRLLAHAAIALQLQDAPPEPA